MFEVLTVCFIYLFLTCDDKGNAVTLAEPYGLPFNIKQEYYQRYNAYKSSADAWKMSEFVLRD